MKVCLTLKIWKTALFLFYRDLSLTSSRHKSGESHSLPQVNVNKKEFVFLPTECRIQPLGMENREILNEAVKASSSWASGYEPWQARLNNIQKSGSSGSWSTRQNAVGQYLQIDLGKERVVNKIATQGRSSTNYSQWVTSYKLLFSSEETNWNEYQNNGVVKASAVKETLFSCCLGHHSKFQDLEHVKGYSCFLLRHEELIRHGLNMLRGVGWGDCPMLRWQSFPAEEALWLSRP